MFAIFRLWIDPMENRDAYGWDLIGVVDDEKEAKRICSLEKVLKSSNPWPLKYISETDLRPELDYIPRFKAKEICNISGYSLEELKHV